LPECRQRCCGEIGALDHRGAYGVVDVMGEICDPISEPAHTAFRSSRRFRDLPRMRANPVEHFPGEVGGLEHFEYPYPLY
jgi:hypothetical protein